MDILENDTNMSNPSFITFEGPEGSGKTTQIKLLAEYLVSLGKKVLVTREPGGTKIGQAIRNILLDKDNQKLSDLAELLLFSADRAQHLTECILPALERDEIVLCDRYVDSTIAYQVGGKQLAPELVNSVSNILDTSLTPDLTILFNVEVCLGLNRATKKHADRFELEDIGFHKRVQAQYLEIAKTEPQRVKIIDINGKSVDKVHLQVKVIIDSLFSNQVPL